MVEWIDSHHRPGWTTRSPVKCPVTCYSVGWLVHDGKKAKVLCSNLTDEESPQRCGDMTIPATAIISIEKL